MTLVRTLPTSSHEIGEVCYGPYGCYNVLAHYAGLLAALPPPEAGNWQHGWIPKERNFDADSIIGWDGRSSERKDQRYRVWRQDQADALHSLGYANAVAIGAPWVYIETDPSTHAPVGGSLLVMPAHSLPEHGHQWDGQDYANYIKSIRHRFGHIALCLHPACIAAGNWVSPFESLGVEVIEGANITDPTSIPKMARLFQRFEFVTGNHFGSFAAYAAFFGAKVSIAGPMAKLSRVELMKSTFFQNAPHLLDRIAEIHEDKPRYFYPHLFVEPWCAPKAKEWGAWQLGVQHRLSPGAVRREFEWSYSRAAKSALRNSLRSRLSPRIRSALRAVWNRL